MIADSTVTYNERDQVMECSACFETVPVRRAILHDPDAFVEMLENCQLDHKECSKYKDVRMAINARRYRKEFKRQILVKSNHYIGVA